MENKKDALAATGGKSRLSGFLSRSYLYIIGLAVIVVLVFSAFLFDGSKMLFGSDTMSGIDSKVLYKTAVNEYHQFPLWFSCRLSGMPTVDALFGDSMYPPSYVFFSIFPIHRALGMRLVFHVFLAGFFFFLLLRKGFRTSRFVAFIGAAFYMLNPEFFSHVYPGHDGKMFVIAWLPFVVWMLKSLLEKPRLLTATFLAFGIAICLYTSHIQMTYFMLWGLFFYWLMHAVLTYLKDKKIGSVAVPTFFFWGAVFAGFGLALIQLYPSTMFIRDAFSVRGVDRGFEHAASWSLHWPEVFSLWVPEFGNFLDYYWSENAFKLNSEYAGAMAAMLAVMAIVLKAKPWRFFWGGLCVFTVMYSLGVHTPVFQLAYYLVPGVKKFRACSMLMFWFSFGTVLLASLFLKDCVSGAFSQFTEARVKKWKKGIGVAVISVTVIALLFSIKGFVVAVMQPLTVAILDQQKIRIFDANFTKNFVPCLWLWWLFAVVCLGLIWGLVAKKVKANVVCAIVLVIGLIDIVRIDMQFIKVINPNPYFASEPVIAELQNEMKKEPFRCFSLPGTFPEQNPEGVHSLEGIDGFHDNELRWYREFRGDQQDRNFFDKIIGAMPDGRACLIPENLKNGNAFLNIANAKYYLIRQGDQLFKIKNEGALRRISFVSGYVVMDSSRIIDALRSGQYDPHKTVALMKEPVEKPAAITDTSVLADSANRMEMQWQSYEPNYRSAKVDVKRDGFLRISEVYYPGWEIRIDHKPVTVYRADLSWMAVNITKGEHLVEMMPHSMYLKKAEMVSFPLMGLLGLYWIFAAVNSAVRRKRK
ncbi:MAG TPA: hypothetical protein DCO75_12025 [Fibrobacteres bacterium]|nr:hypothetical protein [Fibrobacterota bacterium]